ncbi:hypothetical protein KSP39_PZI014038 [Platanthera zijinensis]|uniref:Uncharacterized protein n=1 Tax=Platanthera zijinensis TaxID=2320716 RepID=A0AAP0G430_9ASPA
MPSYSLNLTEPPDLQKMRLLVGAPLKKPPKYPVEEILPVFSYPDAAYIKSKPEDMSEYLSTEALNGFVVHCTSDFISASQKVHVRVRRVRLLGFEGAGKTSLLRALLDQSNSRGVTNYECPRLNEYFIDGLHYVDSGGIRMQELHSSATKFREELQKGTHDLNEKTDLVVLVHNLSQRIDRHQQSSHSSSQPALSALLNEVKALHIPWVLAITNKFSTSAQEQKMLVKFSMEAYGAPPNMIEVINSCPSVVPTVTSSIHAPSPPDSSSMWRLHAQKIILAPINLARIPFQRKDIIFPIEGVASFRKLVHRVLRSHEEMSFQCDLLPCATCTKCAATSQDRDFQRMYEFLLHLRLEFELVRAQLLHQDPPLYLIDTLALMIVEETHLHSFDTTILLSAIFLVFLRHLLQFSLMLLVPRLFTVTTVSVLDMSNLSPVSSDLSIMVADDTILPIISRGLLHTSHFHVLDVAYIPRLSMNLISVGQLKSHDCLVILYEFACRVQDRLTGTLLGAGRHRCRVYVLDYLHLPSIPSSPLAYTFCIPSVGFSQ